MEHRSGGAAVNSFSQKWVLSRCDVGLGGKQQLLLHVKNIQMAGSDWVPEALASPSPSFAHSQDWNVPVISPGGRQRWRLGLKMCCSVFGHQAAWIQNDSVVHKQSIWLIYSIFKPWRYYSVYLSVSTVGSICLRSCFLISFIYTFSNKRY